MNLHQDVYLEPLVSLVLFLVDPNAQVIATLPINLPPSASKMELREFLVVLMEIVVQPVMIKINAFQGELESLAPAVLIVSLSAKFQTKIPANLMVGAVYHQCQPNVLLIAP